MEKIYKLGESNVPLKFKVLDSKMDDETKSIAITNLDKLGELDASTGEYSEMNQWINGLIRISFNEHTLLPVDQTKSETKQKKFIKKTSRSLNKLYRPCSSQPAKLFARCSVSFAIGVVYYTASRRSAAPCRHRCC